MHNNNENQYVLIPIITPMLKCFTCISLYLCIKYVPISTVNVFIVVTHSKITKFLLSSRIILMIGTEVHIPTILTHGCYFTNKQKDTEGKLSDSI